MPAIPRAGEPFPDLCLPDHRGRETRLSDLTAATPYDEMMDFADGYPLILVFYRGFFCPRDGAQVGFEIDHAPSGAEIAVNVQVMAGGVQDGPGSLTAGLVSGLNR